MACIIPDNFFTFRYDPREYRWKLEVEVLSLVKRSFSRNENNELADLARLKVSN